LQNAATFATRPPAFLAIDCSLHHQSVQAEAGGERKVDCELSGVALGDVACKLAAKTVGSALCCDGFLARRYRTGVTVALHITHLD
jgi:primosomal replication protein N